MQETRHFALLEAHHLYPEGLCLELVANPQAAGSPWDLFLNLIWGEHWEPLLGGRVKFALRGGTLSLRCRASQWQGDRHLLSQPVDLTTPQGESRVKFFPVSLGAQEAHWRFESDPLAQTLQGSLLKAPLGQWLPEAGAMLLAGVSVDSGDLKILDAEGLWQHDITPNQHGIFDRAIAQFLKQYRAHPYFSWVQLGDMEQGDRFPMVEQDEIPALEKLQTLLQTIIHSPSDALGDLAELASLDLKQDFAGGNLLGATLREIDWQGAHLRAINLRGADLTDADLSEAQLSGANLSGADLSGAYLEGVNLSGSLGTNASFALGNLIGADLRQADLRGCNWSQAHFRDAQVAGADFRDGVGLTEEQIAYLRDQGAKV